jgi:hypothetical protein
MSVSQLQGNKWPVVSIPSGAQQAPPRRSSRRTSSGFDQFEKSSSCSTWTSRAGRRWPECAPLFPPGRCKVAIAPLKDANEMLHGRARGRGHQRHLARASPTGPTASSADDLAEEASEGRRVRPAVVLETLTELTYGRRYGESVRLRRRARASARPTSSRSRSRSTSRAAASRSGVLPGAAPVETVQAHRRQGGRQALPRPRRKATQRGTGGHRRWRWSRPTGSTSTTTSATDWDVIEAASGTSRSPRASASSTSTT